MKRINIDITAKQPTSPELLIDVRVSIPCFQTSLEAGIFFCAIELHLGCEKHGRSQVCKPLLSGSLLTLQGGFLMLRIFVQWGQSTPDCLL